MLSRVGSTGGIVLPGWRYYRKYQGIGVHSHQKMTTNPTNPQTAPAWRNSTEICALADGERHLGHILKIGERWYAFDGTHSNDESNGFRNLGAFASIGSAKIAVELSCQQGIVQFAGAA